METKFDIVWKQFFNMEFTIQNYSENQDGMEEGNDNTLNFEGTPSNPIQLDEDEDTQIDHHLGTTWGHEVQK